LPWLVIILAGIFGAFIAIEEDKQQKRNLAAFFVFLTILDLGFWPLSWLTINGVPISTGFTVGSMIAYAIYALRANASTDGSKASETVRNLILFFLDQPTFLHLRV
jgi:RsiW-degrading membrane proteinase PrsW (M82 family)